MISGSRPEPGTQGRRAFLRMAGAALGATALSACSHAGTGIVPAAGRGSRPGSGTGASAARPGSVAARPAGATSSDWAALARDLSGRLVRPGEAGYDTARQLFDPRFDQLRPAGIAYCRSPGDVATCVGFARRYGVPLAARSGGHSYAGWSSTTGLIADVSGMSSVRVDSASGTANVGAGTKLIDLYSGLAARGRLVPGGSCPTVGIAGLTLGGGVGVLSRAYGLTCDNLMSLQIVTADGRIRTCDARHDPGLYWACRGGGGGNFGIAASFTFRTRPASTVVLFFLSWPWSRAGKVIAAWQSWAPGAPDELWSNLHLSAAPGGAAPAIQVGGTYLGSTAGAAGLLRKLYAAAGSEPSDQFLESTSYLHAMLVEAGCASLTAGECHLPGRSPGGRLARQPQYARSDFFTRPLSGAGIGTLLAGMENMRKVRGAAGGSGGVAFDAFGGAINRVAPAATAFVHRDALFLAQYTTDWPAGAPPAGVARQRAWQDALYSSMRPYASGQAYQNYIDPGLANWRQAYYGANYRRLAQVKAAYDPARLFRFPQAV